MTYVAGAAAGILLGVLTGVLKYIFIWKKYADMEDESSDPGKTSALYTRMMVSNGINIAVLVICFLIRNIVPFNWIAFICGAAVSLSAANIFMSARNKENRSRKDPD